MKIKSIDFPTDLNRIKDIKDSNIDVFVDIEKNGIIYTYTVTIATLNNISGYMKEDNLSYFRPGYPFILVKSLTKDVVEETIRAYVEEEDSYWLRLYHFADNIKQSMFDILQAEHIQEKKEIRGLDGSYDSDDSEDEFEED